MINEAVILAAIAPVSDTVPSSWQGSRLSEGSVCVLLRAEPGNSGSFSCCTYCTDTTSLAGDPNGSIKWAKIYDGTAEDRFIRVKPTSDNGYIAIGTTKSAASTLFTE